MTWSFVKRTVAGQDVPMMPGCYATHHYLKTGAGERWSEQLYYCRQCLPPQKLAKYAIWEPQDNTGSTGDCRVLYKLMKDAMVI